MASVFSLLCQSAASPSGAGAVSLMVMPRPESCTQALPDRGVGWAGRLSEVAKGGVDAGGAGRAADPAEHQGARPSAGHGDLSVRGRRGPGRRGRLMTAGQWPQLGRVPVAVEAGSSSRGRSGAGAGALSAVLAAWAVSDSHPGRPRAWFPTAGEHRAPAATPPWSPHCGPVFRPSVRPSALRAPRLFLSSAGKPLPP